MTQDWDCVQSVNLEGGEGSQGHLLWLRNLSEPGRGHTNYTVGRGQRDLLKVPSSQREGGKKQ